MAHPLKPYAEQKRASRGFTLLEVMIAIAIFAVIGLGCWQVLHHVTTSKQRLEVRSEQLRELQKASWLIARDIRNLVDRPIRDNNGQHEAAISSLITGYALSLTRSGWVNPLNQPRSTLQRVAYTLEPSDNGKSSLVRYYWPVLDRAPETEPRKQIIISDVSHFEVQFIDNYGESQFHWPLRNDNFTPQNTAQNSRKEIAPLPAGIMLRFGIDPFGEIERLFALRDIEVAQ